MGKEKAHHGNKWMPVMYAVYYGTLKEIAESYGYALAVHGTLSRDFDLLAVPWVDDAGDVEEMLRDMCKAIGVTSHDGKPYHSKGGKPHGRTAYTIISGGGGYLDISVMSKGI